jgi:hypothetical protein
VAVAASIGVHQAGAWRNGLTGIEAMEIGRAVRMLGGDYAGTFEIAA